MASDGPARTQAIATALAPLLVTGDLLILTGDLGAGKTCFAQGLGRGLAVEQNITSPTFTLANRYDGRLVLHHLDVYRLDSSAETLDLDLPELLESGVTVIEWGDRITDVLPADHLVIALRYPALPDPVGVSLAGVGDGTPGGGDGESAVGAGDDDRLIDFIPEGTSWLDRLARLGRNSATGDASAPGADVPPDPEM